MLRNVRVQFLKCYIQSFQISIEDLIQVILLQNDKPCRSFTKHISESILPTDCNRINCNCFSNNYVVLSPLHALVITLSMLLTLWIVPWLSAMKARKLKQQVTQTQKHFLKDIMIIKKVMKN